MYQHISNLVKELKIFDKVSRHFRQFENRKLSTNFKTIYALQVTEHFWS